MPATLPLSRPILFTPGEPAGIGPDLCVQWAMQPRTLRLVAVADPELLAQRAHQLGLYLRLEPYDPESTGVFSPGALELLAQPLSVAAHTGQLDPANAHYVLACLDCAVALCQSGEAAALVTGPVHKGNINSGGIPFSGHTEYIAGLTGGQPVMMLATPGLRVALVTTHLPLRQVSSAITSVLLERIVRTLWQDLRHRFDLSQPRILVCGLNPHAGESGHLGREEIEVIEPVLQRLCAEGMRLTGPVPADTAFTPRSLEKVDAVLAMYHDQGLPVLKHLGFGQAVNITLGLPIIRTSVDHGTALELAGTGKADLGSLRYAIKVAAQMAGLTA